jgi:hypothetical protein
LQGASSTGQHAATSTWRVLTPPHFFFRSWGCRATSNCTALSGSHSQRRRTLSS